MVRERTYAILGAFAAIGLTGTVVAIAASRKGPSGYSISLASSLDSGAVPLNVVFSGTYKDPAGIPIPNVPIIPCANGAPYGDPQLTDSGGRFLIPAVFNTSGAYDCYVTAPFGLQQVESSHITVNCYPFSPVLNIALTSDTRVTSPGSSVQFQAMYTDKSGYPIPYATLEVVVQGTRLVTVRIDELGIATFPIPFPAAGNFNCCVVDSFMGIQSNFITIQVDSKYSGVPETAILQPAPPSLLVPTYRVPRRST